MRCKPQGQPSTSPRCSASPRANTPARASCPSCTAPTSSSTPPKVETVGRATFDIGSHLIWGLLNGLSKRLITGGEAHDMVMKTMMTQTQDGADLLWRILSKDLRCGLTAKSLIKLMPGLFPTFDCMLSHRYERKRIKKFPVAMEPKLDGLRAICLVKSGTAKFFSRVGNHFPALDVLGPMIVDMVAHAHAIAKHEQTINSLMFEYYLMLGRG